MIGDQEEGGVNVVDLFICNGLVRVVIIETKYDPRVLEAKGLYSVAESL